MISPTEAKILSLLMHCQSGAFASELMHMSKGELKRGSIYTTLNRMEQAGLVLSKEEAPTEVYALPRTNFKITCSGIRARTEFGQWTGLTPFAEVPA
jgi:DNA-binding PadR family transcriptional regulator